ncbi:MAG: hypothetical protein Q8904_07085 [Bacteroidota bacterium]|nr:hypothetical protein [Bacteroidota bacterium]
MIYVLITIGAFISIITTAILKSITNDKKHHNLKRAIVLIISLSVFVATCIIILNQKTFE